jgi:hypothetical protein
MGDPHMRRLGPYRGPPGRPHLTSGGVRSSCPRCCRWRRLSFACAAASHADQTRRRVYRRRAIFKRLKPIGSHSSFAARAILIAISPRFAAITLLKGRPVAAVETTMESTRGICMVELFWQRRASYQHRRRACAAERDLEMMAWRRTSWPYARVGVWDASRAATAAVAVLDPVSPAPHTGGPTSAATTLWRLIVYVRSSL